MRNIRRVGVGTFFLDNNVVTEVCATNYHRSGEKVDARMQVSSSLLIKCSAGQQVYVVAFDYGWNDIFPDYGEFVGMLIHKE